MDIGHIHLYRWRENTILHACIHASKKSAKVLKKKIDLSQCGAMLLFYVRTHVRN